MPCHPRFLPGAFLTALLLVSGAAGTPQEDRPSPVGGGSQAAGRTPVPYLRSVRLVPLGKRVQMQIAASGRATLSPEWSPGTAGRMYLEVYGAALSRATVVSSPPANTVVASMRVTQVSAHPPVSRITLTLRPGAEPEQVFPEGHTALLTYPSALATEAAPGPPGAAKPPPKPVAQAKQPAKPVTRAKPPAKRVAQAKRAPARKPKAAPLTRRTGRRRVIAIDVGHGGRDPGASGPRGTREKHVALDVARRVAESLRRRGHRVVLSRTTDRTLGPRSRSAWLKRTPSAVLVSIHCDASTRRSFRGGASTYYHGRSASGRRLARSVQRNLVRRTGARDGGIRSDYTRYGRGFYLLRLAKRPAVLVEAGYISNPKTERLLATASYRQKLADGIADGIVQFLN